MHVMQPLVLDGGWPTTHSSVTNSSPVPPLSGDVALISRVTDTGSFSSSANTIDSYQQNVVSSDGSLKALSQAELFRVGPLSECSADTGISGALTNQAATKTSANPPKPPKKPLTPYMRYSQAVSSCACL